MIILERKASKIPPVNMMIAPINKSFPLNWISGFSERKESSMNREPVINAMIIPDSINDINPILY